jgi:hypothetical protein
MAPAVHLVERRVDLLLLAGVLVTGLVLVIGIVWLVPVLALAAIASAADEA